MSSDETSRLISALQEARALLRRPGNDFAWSGWDDVDEATRDVDAHIAAIERGDSTTLADLVVLFGPTGPLQEVSASSGWSDELAALAKRFERALARARLRSLSS